MPYERVEGVEIAGSTGALEATHRLDVCPVAGEQQPQRRQRPRALQPADGLFIVGITRALTRGASSSTRWFASLPSTTARASDTVFAASSRSRYCPTRSVALPLPSSTSGRGGDPSR